MIICHHTGMAGKDEIANAVLGGASDYMCDIFAKIMQWYYAKDDQKVCVFELVFLYVNLYTHNMVS